MTRKNDIYKIARHISVSRDDDAGYRVMYAGRATRFHVTRNENEPARSDLAWNLTHEDSHSYLYEGGSRRECIENATLRIAGRIPTLHVY